METPKITRNTHEAKKESLAKDLLKLSPEEKAELAKKIKDNGGTIRIVVHPYFAQQHPGGVYSKGSIWSKENPAHQRVDVVEQGLERMLKSQSPVPLFIFESFDEIENTINKIYPILREHTNTVYLVETLISDPRPYTDGLAHDDKQSWQMLVDLYKELGVRKTIIGGMQLVGGEHDNTLNGCVGKSVEVLEKNFDVQISEMSHPNSRKDMKAPDRFKNEK